MRTAEEREVGVTEHAAAVPVQSTAGLSADELATALAPIATLNRSFSSTYTAPFFQEVSEKACCPTSCERAGGNGEFVVGNVMR